MSANVQNSISAARVPVIPGTQLVNTDPNTEMDRVSLSIEASPCTQCVQCPVLNGWAIAGIVVVSLIVLAVLGIAIAAIVMKTKTIACPKVLPRQ